MECFLVHSVYFSGGSKGGTSGAHPRMTQNFLNFMQFLENFPPTGNPGSAPAFASTQKQNHHEPVHYVTYLLYAASTTVTMFEASTSNGLLVIHVSVPDTVKEFHT